MLPRAADPVQEIPCILAKPCQHRPDLFRQTCDGVTRAMLYMLINVSRAGLSAEDYAELGRRANAFYTHVPDGIRLLGDWSANDRSRTFALIETDDPELLEAIQRPFRDYVDIEIVPVTAVSSWRGA